MKARSPVADQLLGHSPRSYPLPPNSTYPQQTLVSVSSSASLSQISHFLLSDLSAHLPSQTHQSSSPPSSHDEHPPIPMATMPIASFRPTAGIARASAAPDESGMRKGPSRRQVPTSGANWWAPIFGWGSGAPDYITGGSSSSSSPSHASLPDGKRSASDDEDGGTARGATARATAGGGSRGRMAPAAVVFTEEKARMLRMKTAEASNFHDVMYHSAIASRLASDFHGHGHGHEQGQGRPGP